MQPAIRTDEDRLVTELIERTNGAADGPAARVAYREGFTRLRSQLERLLDDFASGSDIQPLKKTTSAMKLRVSLMAQSAMTVLGGRDEARELGYIKSQPTADEIILRSIGALPQPA